MSKNDFIGSGGAVALATLVIALAGALFVPATQAAPSGNTSSAQPSNKTSFGSFGGTKTETKTGGGTGSQATSATRSTPEARTTAVTRPAAADYMPAKAPDQNGGGPAVATQRPGATPPATSLGAFGAKQVPATAVVATPATTSPAADVGQKRATGMAADLSQASTKELALRTLDARREAERKATATIAAAREERVQPAQRDQGSLRSAGAGVANTPGVVIVERQTSTNDYDTLRTGIAIGRAMEASRYPQDRTVVFPRPTTGTMLEPVETGTQAVGSSTTGTIAGPSVVTNGRETESDGQHPVAMNQQAGGSAGGEGTGFPFGAVLLVVVVMLAATAGLVFWFGRKPSATGSRRYSL